MAVSKKNTVLVGSMGVSMTYLADGKEVHFVDGVAPVSPEAADELINREGGVYTLVSGKTAAGAEDKTPGSFVKIQVEMNKLVRDNRVLELSRFFSQMVSRIEALHRQQESQNLQEGTLAAIAKETGQMLVPKPGSQQAPPAKLTFDGHAADLIRKDKATEIDELAGAGSFVMSDGTTMDLAHPPVLPETDVPEDVESDDNISVDGVKEEAVDLALEHEQDKQARRDSLVKKKRGRPRKNPETPKSLKKRVKGMAGDE